MLSNESYMNLVMSEVLPTDCSPRKTSLNFRRGLPKSPEEDMVNQIVGLGLDPSSKFKDTW